MKNFQKPSIFILLVSQILITVSCSNQTDTPGTDFSQTESYSSPPLTETWTSVPTYSFEEAQIRLQDIYSNNGGCSLPCWWGIMPGETSWSEASNLLSPFGYVSSPFPGMGMSRFELHILIPEGTNFPSYDFDGVDNRYFTPDIFTQNGVVKTIGINAGWISSDYDYTLTSILGLYGPPNEIWLKLITDVLPEEKPEYYIILFYPTKGMLIGANGESERQGSSLVICPQIFQNEIFPPAITLWNPSEIISFDEIGSALYGGMGSWVPSEYHLLDDIGFGYSSNDFFNTYTNPTTFTNCFIVNPTAP